MIRGLVRRALPLPVVGALCLVAFAVGLGLARAGGSHAADPLAARVRVELQEGYYRPLSSQVLALGTVPAMIAALHDPYTTYLDPAAYRLIRGETSARYSGVGLTLWPVAGGLGVAAAPRGPARRAHVLVGDVVTAIDGVPAAGLGFDEALGRILGPAGTEVTLEVRRGGAARLVRLVRRQLSAPPIQFRLLESAGRRVAYLRLESFRTGAASATAEVLKRLEHDGASAAILDLRGNPGGLLAQAVAVSSLFLKHGTIVSIEGAHLARVVYRASGGPVEPRLRLAVLVDRWSASAAEVVAAALRDNGRATLVGESTFGKGLVQALRPLPNGGALKLTTARYLTPRGTDISGVGVRPDVTAYDDPSTPADDALNAALEVVTSQ
jgi:carboxyl-terminal processing protease